MAEKCDECFRPIKERKILAMDKCFHPECFVCTHCKKAFADGKYMENKNKPYCKFCFNKLCEKCNKVIALGDPKIEFGGKKGSYFLLQV